MKRTVRKIFAAFLLLTSSMPFLFTIFFLLNQQVIRHKMKEKLEKEFLHTISVPQDEVTWVKYKKEIRVENKLFDVESFYARGDVCYFTGLFDSEETALNTLLERKNDKENTNDTTQLIHWLQSPCTNLDFEDTQAIVPVQSFYTPILLQISFPFISPPTQPPQV